MNVCNKHAPIRTCRVRNKHNPWVTPNIIKLMYKRDFLHDKAIKTGDSDIWANYKKMRNLVNRTIKKNIISYYENIINKSQKNSKTFWKELGKIVPSKINFESIPKELIFVEP